MRESDLKIFPKSRILEYSTDTCTVRFAAHDLPGSVKEEPQIYCKVCCVLGVLEISTMGHGKGNSDQADYLCVVVEDLYMGSIDNVNIFRIKKVKFISLENHEITTTGDEYEAEEVAKIEKFIQAHDFFYIDTERSEFLEKQFIWNRHMNKSFLKHCKENGGRHFKISKCSGKLDYGLRNMFSGHFRFRECAVAKDTKGLSVKILSTISCNKIGPRFYCRGVDDYGNVSFFR
jgi:hypothetical protein